MPAEGYTFGGSDHLLMQNPNDAMANVTVTYQLDDGTNIQRLHSIGVQRRYTIRCRDAGQVGAGYGFSTKVESDVPIVVERSMYWGGYAGGHCSAGYPMPWRRGTPAGGRNVPARFWPSQLDGMATVSICGQTVRFPPK